MRRAIAAILVTIAGVIWLETYRVTPHQQAVASTSPRAAPSATPSAPAAPTAPPAANALTASPSPTPAAVSHTYTGSNESTIYGDVQVRITVKGGRMGAVQAVQLPSDRARSAEISQYVGPILSQEAVQAQNAQIDVISGATYTSYAYAQSLSDALHQAHLG